MKQLTIALVLSSVLAVSGCANSDQPQQDSRGIPENAPTIVGRFKEIPDAVPGPVDAFGFEISLGPLREEQYLMPWQRILLTVQSTKMVSSETGTSIVEVNETSLPGLIDITAKRLHRPSLDGGSPRMVPEKWFQVRLDTLWFPKDRPVYLRLRFRDAEEYFALTFESHRGLQLVEINNCFGKVKEGSIKEFGILEMKEGSQVYQCDNLSIFARDDQKDLWRRQIPLEVAPKEFRIVGETLFVLSTRGHSLYVRKCDGKIVFYHKSALAGKSPWDEILEVAREAYRRGGPQEGVPLFTYIGAAALLEEKRAAPFLIECIEKGSGLVERWWAVAALEHLNGNSEYWKEMGEGQPWDPVGRGSKWDDKRVYPDAAAKAEVQKWEKVFGKVEKPLLTRPEN